MQYTVQSNRNTRGIVIAVVLFILNVFSTKVNHLGLLIGMVGYFIVVLALLQKRSIFALKFFLLFLTTTIEFDAYVYYGGYNYFSRYSFINMPFVGPFAFYLLAFLVLIGMYNAVTRSKESKLPCQGFLKHMDKWLIVFLVTGILSASIGMLCNDNSIMQLSLYPTASITTMMNFIALSSIIMASIYATRLKQWHNEISQFCQEILIAAVISSVIVFLFGWRGYYGTQSGLMLMAMGVAFTPLLLLFSCYDTMPYRKLSAVLFFIVIIISFFTPVVIGSKWYLIILVSLACWTIRMIKRRVYKVILVTVFLLPVVGQLASGLLSIVQSSHFINWKLSQVITILDFSQYTSVTDWFNNLENSPKFRLDEFANISIEYFKKPMYFLFGKGFAGTTLHHTNLLDWERGGGTFSREQITHGIYYQMHESINLIYLRHGLCGLTFFISMISSLIKHIKCSPWAAIGLIWFVFYWGFGNTLWIGAVAIVLALNSQSDKNIINEKNLELI